MLAPQGIPVAGGANVPAWELIDSYEDTDTGTIFDYDSGTVTVYNMYMVILSGQDHSGAGNSFRITFQGDTSANYTRYDAYDGIDYTGNSNAIVMYISADGAAQAIMWIRGGNMVSDPAAPYPTMVTDQLSSECQYVDVLEVEYANVDRIEIKSDDVATGRLKLYGLNF